MRIVNAMVLSPRYLRTQREKNKISQHVRLPRHTQTDTATAWSFSLLNEWKLSSSRCHIPPKSSYARASALWIWRVSWIRAYSMHSPKGYSWGFDIHQTYVPSACTQSAPSTFQLCQREAEGNAKFTNVGDSFLFVLRTAMRSGPGCSDA